jgi:predicted DCC family thiol-disulfide oxidoreductase YuxK
LTARGRAARRLFFPPLFSSQPGSIPVRYNSCVSAPIIAAKEKNSSAELTVLFDGACPLCRASAERIRRHDPAGRIELLDLHDPSIPARFPRLDMAEAMRLMQAVDRGGRISSGVDAWARIGMTLPGWKWFAWLLLLPGIHLVAARVYGWVARNRYRWNRDACADGSCALHGR